MLIYHTKAKKVIKVNNKKLFRQYDRLANYAYSDIEENAFNFLDSLYSTKRAILGRYNVQRAKFWIKW